MKSGSGFGTIFFTPLGGASFAAKSNFQEQLANGKKLAKDVHIPLMASWIGLENKSFSPLDCTSVAA